jgi:hypothetical protein
MTHTKLYWRLREYWSGVVDRFFSAAILMAISVPFYFIVVWIFPGLEYHGTAKGRAFWSIPLIYTFGLFAAVAVAAVVLFVVVAILVGAVRVLLRRDDD